MKPASCSMPHPQVPLPAKVSFVSAEAQFTPACRNPSEREKLSYRVKLVPPVGRNRPWRTPVCSKAGLTGNGFVRLRSRPIEAGW